MQVCGLVVKTTMDPKHPTACTGSPPAPTQVNGPSATTAASPEGPCACASLVRLACEREHARAGTRPSVQPSDQPPLPCRTVPSKTARLNKRENVGGRETTPIERQRDSTSLETQRKPEKPRGIYVVNILMVKLPWQQQRKPVLLQHGLKPTVSRCC